MNKNNFYAIVMAGGRGERFWPQSRVSHPKQLLRLIGNLTLIEQTVERLMPLIPAKNILVITNQEYVLPMRSLLSKIPGENIIGEPIGRDTAPCVALAAGIVKAKSNGEEAIMMLLPSDHVIRDTDSMLEVLADSAEIAGRTGNIITVGVNPDFASTGYGYIHCGEDVASGTGTKFFRSLGFKEKPNMETAEKFIAAKCYKWNSGMFIWKTATIMDALRKYAPSLAVAAETFAQAVTRNELNKVMEEKYKDCEKISIDYAVMEKADNVIVGECSFDWDDVGSWTALRNQIRPSRDNNVIRGLYEGLDTSNCIIVGDTKHLIATIDVEDLIIIHTDDATLVCNAKSAQRIKELVLKIGLKPELSKFL